MGDIKPALPGVEPARSGLDAAHLIAADFVAATPARSAQARRELPGAAVLAESIADERDPMGRSATVTLLYW